MLPFAYRKAPPRFPRRPDESERFLPPPVVSDVDDRPRATPAPVEIAHDPVIDPSLLSINNRPTVPPVGVAPVAPVTPATTRPRVVNSMPAGPSPWAIEYEKGRPVRVSTTSNDPEAVLEGKRALKQATDDYIPQKATGWRRFLGPAAQLAMAGLGGGRGGRAHPLQAAGGAIVGALQGWLNPKGQDQAWKAQRQAEVNEDINQTLKQRKEEAAITNLEMQPALKQEANRIRELGVNQRGERIDDLRIKNALDYYNKIDYEPGANPTLDKYFQESGLHDLPPRKKDDTYQVVWSGGQLMRVAKRTGEATPVTSGGKAVVDPTKVPNQSVKINGITYDNLTSKEAAILSGRAYEGAQNRASRERIAAAGQSGQDRRTAANINARQSNVLNTSLRGAIIAISKFRNLTTRIEHARSYGDWQTAAALDSERNGHEQVMRSVYGDMLQDDEAGKPTILNESYTNPPDGQSQQGADLTGQSRSISEWRKKYPNVTKDQETKWRANVAGAGGTVIP